MVKIAKPDGVLLYMQYSSIQPFLGFLLMYNRIIYGGGGGGGGGPQNPSGLSVQ